MESTEETSFDALIEADTAHTVGTVELRASRHWAFIGEARMSAFGRIRGEVEAVSQIDEFTEVEAMVAASVLPFDRLGAAHGALLAALFQRAARVGLGKRGAAGGEPGQPGEDVDAEL